MKSNFAALAACAIVLSSLASAQRRASVDSSAPCTLAIVSRTQGPSENICDAKLVRGMAVHGHVFEQNQLGIAAMLAIGPDYSEQEALQWFARAAQRGYAPAQVNLAVMYANGWATPVNYGAAVRWLLEAANQRFPRAYYNLGVLYLNGQGVHRDYHEAFRWFEKGAEVHDSDAETNLGFLYDQGLGCARDSTAAVNWYRQAALAGNPLGENNLADMYLRGLGVPQSDAEAFHWFQKAAADGSTGARIKLAYMYSQGLGVKQDAEIAYMWGLSASLAGDRRGDDLLAALQAQLSSKQLAAIRGRLSETSDLRRPKIAQSNFVQ